MTPFASRSKGVCKPSSVGTFPSHKSGDERTHESSEARRLRQVFDAFDENSDGLLTVAELSAWMQKVGMKLSADAIVGIVDSCDWDDDACLNFEEFLDLNKMLQYEGKEGVPGGDEAGSSGTVESSISADDDMKEAFRVFDKDGNGQISPDELQVTLSDLGFLAAGTNLSRICSMIRRVDVDGDGQVNFVEFQTMMKGA